MPEALDAASQVKPYVHETLTTKALHFSIHEMQSRMLLQDPYALDLEYTRTMMAFLLFQAEPRHIAMIGLGGGSLAKFCHRHLPGARVAVVEINPHIIALRDEFHVPADSRRFQVIHGDGAQHVGQSTRAADVLMVDGFTSEGLPSRLSSQRFYDDCFDFLKPGGVLVLNLHSGHRQCAQHVTRVQRSFGGSVLVVDDGEMSNTVVFACKGPALDQARPGLIRRPKALERAGAEQLLGAFARVGQALLDRQAP